MELCQNLYTYYVFEKNITMSQNLTFLFDSMDSFYCLQCIYFPLRTKLFYSLSILKVNAFSLFLSISIHISLLSSSLSSSNVLYHVCVKSGERGEKQKRFSTIMLQPNERRNTIQCTQQLRARLNKRLGSTVE